MKTRINWKKRWLLAAVVVGVCVGVVAMRPSDASQQEACAKQCYPKVGAWQPDPAITARAPNKDGLYACVCK